MFHAREDLNLQKTNGCRSQFSFLIGFCRALISHLLKTTESLCLVRDSFSLTCIGGVTTLAGSAQGYKDGIGENAKFHHTSGEEYKMETEDC